MLSFALFLKMANGATYSIVPFINSRAIGSVAGIVGAGGNLGAMLIAFLFKSNSITYSQAFHFIGIGVLVTGLLLLAIGLKESLPAGVAVSKAKEQLQGA